MLKRYDDAPKWFHPGIGRRVQNNVDGVEEILFENKEVVVTISPDADQDTLIREIEEETQCVCVPEKNGDKVLLSHNFR
jgi:nucleoside-triphosphatase THEP1